MFNNLYQMEHAGQTHQQALLEIQRQAEQARAAQTINSTPSRSMFAFLAQPVRFVVALTLDPRSAAGWLTRLLVFVAAVAWSAHPQPAAAAAATGGTTSASHGVVDPLSTGNFSPVQDPAATSGNSLVTDPFNGGSFSPISDPGDIGGTCAVVDPFNAGNFSPVQDPAATSGNSLVTDPFNGGSFSPVQDPTAAESFNPVVAAATPAAPATFSHWLTVFLAGLAGIGGLMLHCHRAA